MRSERYLTIDESSNHIQPEMQRCYTSKNNGKIFDILDAKATNEMQLYEAEIKNETNQLSLPMTTFQAK